MESRNGDDAIEKYLFVTHEPAVNDVLANSLTRNDVIADKTASATCNVPRLHLAPIIRIHTAYLGMVYSNPCSM